MPKGLTAVPVVDGLNNDTMEIDCLGAVALIRIVEHSTGNAALISLSVSDVEDAIKALEITKNKIESSIRKGKKQ